MPGLGWATTHLLAPGFQLHGKKSPRCHFPVLLRQSCRGYVSKTAGEKSLFACLVEAIISDSCAAMKDPGNEIMGRDLEVMAENNSHVPGGEGHLQLWLCNSRVMVIQNHSFMCSAIRHIYPAVTGTVAGSAW